MSLKTILIMVSVSAVIIIIAILIGVFTNKTKEEEKENINDIETDIIPPLNNYTKEEFYSTRTKSYINLINNLEKEKAILYHWNLELDENNNAIFKNKYKDLYDYNTDLKPRNASVGYHLYKPENYRIIYTDLMKYYKAKNETMPNHLIYGPSINGK